MLEERWFTRGIRSRRIKANSFLMCMLIVATAIAFFPSKVKADYPQIAERPAQVKRVYVGTFGSKPGAIELQEKLIRCLRRIHAIELVGTPEEADAVITGTGEIWIKEYIRTDPKPSPWNREAVYDGYLSVELRGRDNQRLWSCRVKHGTFAWDDITQELAKRLTKHLKTELKQSQEMGD